VAVLIVLVAIVVVVLLANGWRTHRAWTSVDRQARRFHERQS
jgi:hypothetical protein